MMIEWLASLITKSAMEIELKNRAIFQFSNKIDRLLAERPIQDWEADGWARGLKRRLIKMESYFFRIGSGKNSALSFFVRNDAGLYVGLRREAITQAATYVSLITDYGYARASTRFETHWMDVAVYDEARKALLYAENKARAATLEKLCGRLETEFRETIPFVPETDKAVDDVLMKASHLWKHRPRYFWGVSPTLRRSYEVNYSTRGFTLAAIHDVPTAHGGSY